MGMWKAMLAALVLCTACFAIVTIASEPALAQQSGGKGKDKNERPPPPPPPRCPDLALATYQFVSTVPNGPPLADGEVAILYDVRNSGSAPYTAAAQGQSLTFEYTTPGGPQQIATITIPTSDQAANSAVQLAQGQSWRGYLRTPMPPEARRRPLRLRITYASDFYHRPANDCDTGNNEAVVHLPVQ